MASLENASSRSARPKSLSKTAIIECALTLSQSEGPKGLSLRRIGRELGVDATAFYRYFQNKDDLIRACMDSVLKLAFDAFLEASEARPKKPFRWRDVIREATWVFFRVSQDFPVIVSLGFARVTGGEGERRWIEFILTTLSGVGLTPELTAVHYRAIADAMLSMAALRAGVNSLSLELMVKDKTTWSTVYAKLPIADYPVTRAHAAYLEAVTPDEVFQAVMDGVLDGIERTLP